MTLYDLNTLGFLTVQGKDAVKFLQGQCTQDISQLKQGIATAGAFCTAKGRAITNVWLVKPEQDDCIHMLCAANSAEPLLNHLKKYIPFFRGTTMTDNSEQFKLIGHASTDDSSLGEIKALFQAQLPDERIIIAVENHSEQLATLNLQASLWWQQQDIYQQVLWLNSDQVERFIPQNFSLDDLDGISYKKGCYTGQEVVARLHFKGQSRKHLYRISWPTIENKTDADIYTEAGVAGTIVQETIDADQTIALAVLSDRNLEQLYADNERRVAVTLLD
ncbi:YgfZ/GcvT domain-containing protein [Reinekea thalattae]|uniref:Folate-binding protein YgfZ n=1 Tax=Reinekea thalattae TaxID=2593301 RepID=A0A5C8Z6Y5_9GAMM|nr:folate-binding protein YgfZ [Reinekea thalattae]TXR53069.1 folate-binding protein YgfZ [Reinekea thalattae]